MPHSMAARVLTMPIFRVSWICTPNSTSGNCSSRAWTYRAHLGGVCSTDGITQSHGADAQVITLMDGGLDLLQRYLAREWAAKCGSQVQRDLSLWTVTYDVAQLHKGFCRRAVYISSVVSLAYGDDDGQFTDTGGQGTCAPRRLGTNALRWRRGYRSDRCQPPPVRPASGEWP